MQQTATVTYVKPDPGEVLKCHFCRCTNMDSGKKDEMWFKTGGGDICEECLKKTDLDTIDRTNGRNYR